MASHRKVGELSDSPAYFLGAFVVAAIVWFFVWIAGEAVAAFTGMAEDVSAIRNSLAPVKATAAEPAAKEASQPGTTKTFACPSCDALNTFPEDAGGNRRCKKCGRAIEVPLTRPMKLQNSPSFAPKR